MTQLPDYMRHLLKQPALLAAKHTIRSIQTLWDYADFRRVRHLTLTLPLAALLERQPRFSYKYLSRYTAASFSRTTRLAAILNHYQFLVASVGAGFFELVATKPVVWQAQHGPDTFAVVLSYPALVGFEGELSLSLLLNDVLLQVVSFVIVPGQLVGYSGGQTLLMGQVQGTRQAALHKHATKVLLDIAPAALLVNAAYGLAAALRIGRAAGISNEEKLSIGAGNCFDYNALWEQLGGVKTAGKLFLLAIPAPEKPIESIKSNHRARTLRKRQYKQAVRGAVEHTCHELFAQLRQPVGRG